MTQSRILRRSWFGPIMLGSAYFLFAWLTISRQYTFDSISYLLDVSRTQLQVPLRADNVAYNFFHSQHLLFSPLVYLFIHAWRVLGYAGPDLLPAQLLNLIEGSVTLALFFATLRGITGDSLLSILMSTLLGLSFAFWDNTAMISDHMASCLMALLFFRALSGTSFASAPSSRIAFLGFLNGLAFLMHQVNGLLGLVFLAALAAQGFRLRALGMYLVAAGVTASIPYLLVGVVILGNSSPHDFMYWCFYYAMPGVIDVAGRYGTVGVGKIADLLQGMGASIVGGFYWMNRIFENRPLQRYGVPVFSAMAAILLLLTILTSRVARRDSEPPRELRAGLMLSAAWFIAYALLLYWWWPSYYQMWAVPLTGLALFTGVYLHRNLGAPLRSHRWMAAGLASAALIVGGTNALAAYCPSHDIGNNDYYVTTMEIQKATREGDLIVVPGDDEYEIYIPYFAGRGAVSLHALLVEHLNNLPETFDDLDEVMAGAWKAGHDVYIVSELRDTVRDYIDLYELHHLTNDMVSRHFRQFDAVGTIETRSLKLYRIRSTEEGA